MRKSFAVTSISHANITVMREQDTLNYVM